MITKTCEICGGHFEVKPYRATTARFCSRACGGVWHCKHRLPAIVSERMKGNRYRVGKKPSHSFPKGNIPWNRDKKGIHLSPSSEFVKGCESNRKVPVGTVRIRECKGGQHRAFIKVGDPRGWKMRAVHVWETHFGKVPSGCVIHHRDRNPLNDSIDNLMCMSRQAHINEHRGDLKIKQ